MNCRWTFAENLFNNTCSGKIEYSFEFFFVLWWNFAQEMETAFLLATSPSKLTKKVFKGVHITSHQISSSFCAFYSKHKNLLCCGASVSEYFISSAFLWYLQIFYSKPHRRSSAIIVSRWRLRFNLIRQFVATLPEFYRRSFPKNETYLLKWATENCFIFR